MRALLAGSGPALPVALLITFFGLVGCEASSDGSGTSIALMDEDGVPTLTVEGLWEPDWPHLPSLEVDTLISPSDGDGVGLVAPLHAAILADDRIVVADVGTRRVWIASDAGEWSEGPGPGEGPGELRSIGGVWPSNGGFIVHDPQAGDLVRFDADGGWLDRSGVGIEHAVHGAGSSIGAWAPSVHRVDAVEWLAVVPMTSEIRSDGPVQRVEARFVRVFGHPADREMSLGTGPLRDLFVEGGGGAPIPFARSSYAAAASGSVVMFLGDDPFVEVQGPDGTVTRRVRWTDAPQALGASHRGALGDYMREIAPDDIPPEALENLIANFQDIPLPERLPHLGDLRLGEDGAIWLGWPERSGLEVPTEPELVREWRMVPPEGWDGEAQVFRVTLPEGATLLGPVIEAGEARAPGWSGAVRRGSFFVLLRDPMGRQGIGVLRYGATAP
jgi:hypothetical protein